MVCLKEGGVSVLAVVEAGRLGLGKGKRESSGGVGRRGVAIKGGGHGTGRYDVPGMRVGHTE